MADTVSESIETKATDSTEAIEEVRQVETAVIAATVSLSVEAEPTKGLLDKLKKMVLNSTIDLGGLEKITSQELDLFQQNLEPHRTTISQMGLEGFFRVSDGKELKAVMLQYPDAVYTLFQNMVNNDSQREASEASEEMMKLEPDQVTVLRQDFGVPLKTLASNSSNLKEFKNALAGEYAKTLTEYINHKINDKKEKEKPAQDKGIDTSVENPADKVESLKDLAKGKDLGDVTQKIEGFVGGFLGKIKDVLNSSPVGDPEDYKKLQSLFTEENSEFLKTGILAIIESGNSDPQAIKTLLLKAIDNIFPEGTSLGTIQKALLTLDGKTSETMAEEERAAMAEKMKTISSGYRKITEPDYVGNYEKYLIAQHPTNALDFGEWIETQEVSLKTRITAMIHSLVALFGDLRLQLDSVLNSEKVDEKTNEEKWGEATAKYIEEKEAVPEIVETNSGSVSGTDSEATTPEEVEETNNLSDALSTMGFNSVAQTYLSTKDIRIDDDKIMYIDFNDKKEKSLKPTEDNKETLLKALDITDTQEKLFRLLPSEAPKDQIVLILDHFMALDPELISEGITLDDLNVYETAFKNNEFEDSFIDATVGTEEIKDGDKYFNEKGEEKEATEAKTVLDLNTDFLYGDLKFQNTKALFVYLKSKNKKREEIMEGISMAP